MNKFVYRMLCKNYELSAKAMVKEWKRYRHDISVMRHEAIQEYQENLRLLRIFLDNEVGVMPRPKWHYDDKDESTWLFTNRRDLNKNFMMLQDRRR